MPKTRKEKDALWEMKISKEFPWGIFTERVLSTYPNSDLVPELFLRMYIKAKMTYATVNARFRKIDQEMKKAIHLSGKEVLKLDSNDFMTLFPVGQIQSGWWTSTNMMINEVLANMTNIAFGKKYGDKKVSSHDHLNLSQSSNDTFPWVTKLTLLHQIPKLIKEVESMIKILKTKSRNRKDIKKVWRTHLQDAVVIAVGDEFAAYAASLEKNKKYLTQVISVCKELPFGGTATGSLQNIKPAFRKELIKEFSKLAGTKCKAPKSYFEQNSSSADFVVVSQSLVLLANNLIKISNDLRLLSSGPFAWFGELILPQVHAWSSIMPGKINPSVLEALTMVCAKVIGNDQTIQVLSRQAQLELQQFMPGIAFPLLESVDVLIKGCDMATKKCLRWIRVNKKHIHKVLESSMVFATDYTQELGYEKVEKLVKKAVKEKRNLKELLERERK